MPRWSFRAFLSSPLSTTSPTPQLLFSYLSPLLFSYILCILLVLLLFLSLRDHNGTLLVLPLLRKYLCSTCLAYIRTSLSVQKATASIIIFFFLFVLFNINKSINFFFHIVIGVRFDSVDISLIEPWLRKTIGNLDMATTHHETGIRKYNMKDVVIFLALGDFGLSFCR